MEIITGKQEPTLDETWLFLESIFASLSYCSDFRTRGVKATAVFLSSYPGMNLWCSFFIYAVRVTQLTATFILRSSIKYLPVTLGGLVDKLLWAVSCCREIKIYVIYGLNVHRKGI
jgi:hypothetical protein